MNARAHRWGASAESAARYRDAIRDGLCAAVLMAVAWGCSADQARPYQGTVVTDSAGVAIVEHGPLTGLPECRVEAEGTPTIGIADGPDHLLLHLLRGATVLSDGRIVLVNQSTAQLRFFDSEGRFLMQVGRRGEGPGEFGNPYYVWALPGDTVWVADTEPVRFQVFGPDGSWQRAVTLSAGGLPRHFYLQALGLLEDGTSITVYPPREEYGTPYDFRMRRLHVFRYGSDGELLDTLGTFSNAHFGARSGDIFYVAPLFAARFRFAAGRDRIVLAHGSTPELQVLRVGEGVQLERIVRWDAGDRTVTGRDVEDERRRIREENASDPDYDAVVGPQIHSDRPIADEFPAFDRVAVGTDGRLWIREHARPTAAPGSSWIVFSADGEVECSARLPGFASIFEFGADYILASQLDEMGVVRLGVHRVARPVAGDG